MEEGREAVRNTIELVGQVADLFYRQQDKDGYFKLNELIGQISNAMEYVLGNGQNEVSEECSGIIEYLNEALGAMEARDTILLADLLQYEIKDRFQKLYEMM
ncbi:MAG TPA: hypothetical protein GXX75_09295 [Clostridiales bacterium]|nr:hypothetical protein [Clostridiales bacterium]